MLSSIENSITSEELKLKRAELKAKTAIANYRSEVVKAQKNMLRGIRNSGYSEGGASRSKKSMKGWRADSRSPQDDIDVNLSLLRQRSRSLFMSSPLGRSAVNTNRTNVVGAGLKLKSRIDFEYLRLTNEQADNWEMAVEREFAVWADSVWCDSQRLNNFYELQQIALISWLMNGDGLGLIKRVNPQPWMPYGLRIHLIESDRLSTPFSSDFSTVIVKAENGNRIINGVEVDGDGAVVAYHICNNYPNSYIPSVKTEWTRVEAFGSLTGNPNILHLMENERCEQYRGVPYLAPVIETLKQITRYTEAELMAAVVTSFFTAFIKQSSPTTDTTFPTVIPEEERVDSDPNAYELGAGTINVLGQGEDVIFADPKRPASGFEPFVNVMAKYIGAALEIPYELLTKSFTASYSASRAALLEAWKAFKMRRTWFANDFCQPIYELWLTEAVARGRIIAPGFFNDPAIKKAWSRADWNGPAAGQIDPVKEVQAASMKVAQGFSTRERETIEINGGDWDRNITQVKKENALLTEAGISINANNQASEGGKNKDE